MNFCLVVLSSPYGSEAPLRAARFARALLEQSHEVGQVFFYDEGTYTGLGSAVSPQGEQSAVEAWGALQQEHNLELILCIGSAIKRGILDANEAQRHEHPASTIHPAFTLAGLGQLVDASSRCDRLVSFG